MEVHDPVHTAAYSRASFEKLSSNQHLMIDGSGPRSSKPGGGPILPGLSMAGDLGSKAKLFRRVEYAECPAELCRPSDLWEEERSTMGKLPSPLPVRTGKNSLDDLDV